MTERIRLTISITPEVHEVFSQIATVSGVSLGRCMGDWLNDTLEGAQFVAAKMQQAKRAPQRVMAELHALGTDLEADRKRDLAALKRETAPPKRRPAGTPAARSTAGVSAGAAAKSPRPVIRGESPPLQDVLEFVRRGAKP